MLNTFPVVAAVGACVLGVTLLELLNALFGEEASLASVFHSRWASSAAASARAGVPPWPLPVLPTLDLFGVAPFPAPLPLSWQVFVLLLTDVCAFCIA